MPPKKKYAFKIYGFEGCGWFTRAITLLEAFKRSHSTSVTTTTIDVNSVPYEKWASTIARLSKAKNVNHNTSPFILCNSKYIGGHDSLVAWIRANM
jgi:hypothetical protein